MSCSYRFLTLWDSWDRGSWESGEAGGPTTLHALECSTYCDRWSRGFRPHPGDVELLPTLGYCYATDPGGDDHLTSELSICSATELRVSSTSLGSEKTQRGSSKLFRTSKNIKNGWKLTKLEAKPTKLGSLMLGYCGRLFGLLQSPEWVARVVIPKKTQRWSSTLFRTSKNI